MANSRSGSKCPLGFIGVGSRRIRTFRPKSKPHNSSNPVTQLVPLRTAANQSVRVRAQLLDRLVNQAGEVMIARSRLDARMTQVKGSLLDLSGNLDRLRQQLRLAFGVNPQR